MIRDAAKKQNQLLRQAHPTRQHTSISWEPFPGGRVASQAWRAPPAPWPCLLQDPTTQQGWWLQCSTLRQHQAMAPGGCCQPQLPLCFTSVQSSWKHQIIRPQPERAQGSTHQPPLPTEALEWCPGTGGYSKSNAISTHPAITPHHFPPCQRPHLLPDWLRAICFWQQLRKYMI